MTNASGASRRGGTTTAGAGEMSLFARPRGSGVPSSSAGVSALPVVPETLTGANGRVRTPGYLVTGPSGGVQAVIGRASW